MGALRDRRVGAALAHLHRAPERGWTNASLAGTVGMSRSRFAARFTSLVGEPPLSYLTRWRLETAARLLEQSELGLGEIADRHRIRTALANVLRRNGRPSRFGMVNSTLPDGSLDATNDHAKNVWAGMNYAFISLCLMNGFPAKNLLKEARKIWDNACRMQKNPWSLPDTIDAKTGRYVFGDSYYRNMAIWSIPLALAKKDLRVSKILNRLKGLR